MTSIALAAVRFLGLPGMIVLGMLIFYEGLPLGPLRWIPYVGPALAEFVDGRVDRERQIARDVVLAEARARALDLIEKRTEDNAEISTFDAAQLCVELGGKWVLADSTCN